MMRRRPLHFPDTSYHFSDRAREGKQLVKQVMEGLRGDACLATWVLGVASLLAEDGVEKLIGQTV